MSKTLTKTTDLEFSTGLVLQVLTDADYVCAQASSRDEVVDATYKETSRSDERLVFEVHTTEHARGLTGIDRSKTEPAVQRSDWDLQARTCRWAYEGAHSDRFTFRGRTTVEPRGDQTRVTVEYFVDVSIPLLGGRIEKAIIKELEAAHPSYGQLIRRYCRDRA